MIDSCWMSPELQKHQRFSVSGGGCVWLVVLLHCCMMTDRADASVEETSSITFFFLTLVPVGCSIWKAHTYHTSTVQLVLYLHVLYGSSITMVFTRHFPIFLPCTHRQCVKCDINLHADNDFQRDYTQLIDGHAVTPETTLGDVIWLSRYQTLKHIPVVNLPKWAFTEDIRHPRALTGNERQPFPVARLNAAHFKAAKITKWVTGRELCWHVSLFTDVVYKLPCKILVWLYVGNQCFV